MNINLPAFGIKIKLTGPEQSCGSITSDLHEKGESPELKAAIDSIEGLILAHARREWMSSLPRMSVASKRLSSRL